MSLSGTPSQTEGQMRPLCNHKWTTDVSHAKVHMDRARLMAMALNTVAE